MKKILSLLISLVILTACSSVGNEQVGANQLDASEEAENSQEAQFDTSFLTNTYVNEELGFSIKYPTSWSLRDYKEWTGSQIMEGTLDKEIATIEGVIDLAFANTQEEFDNIYEIPEGYQSVGMRIYRIESDRHDNGYRNEFLASLDYNERLEDVEVTTYKVNGKELTLYIYETERSSDTLPRLKAEAFYKGKNYAYSFGVSSDDYTNNEKNRLIAEEYLKPMLATFEDLGGEVKKNDDFFSSESETVEPEEDEIQEAFISIPDINTLSPADNGAYYIYGSTSDNCDKVVVTAINMTAGIRDEYELEEYKKGNTSFRYGIREDFDNMAVGTNTYLFTAYCEGGQVKEVSTVLDYTIEKPTYNYIPPPTAPLPAYNSYSPVIESRIDGDFEGWEGDTIFKLTNGQIWQQDSYDYLYDYSYMPDVTIYKSGFSYEMQVEGVDETIEVKRLD